QRLTAENLLKDPIVIVEFLNATVSLLGDVSSPGEYPIDRDNMTILQALGKAGDLQITGMRQNVLVVREENGKDVAYRLDLTDTETLMTSPAFYVQQNDVIYVEPNDTKKRQSTANGNTFLTPGFWLSIISFLTSMVVLILR
ncbi:MAG: polysaccharide export protein, partial [Muribaculaceae bacterium]|nr:polysaccharide export protein [Muribaculaceae bacterium]